MQLASFASTASQLPLMAIRKQTTVDILFNGGPGVFSVGLGVESLLSRKVSVGGRFGGLLTTSPTSGGIPLDVFLRLRLGRVYLEGVGGPWIFFTGDALRGHAAVGFGMLAQDLEFGAEFGRQLSSHYHPEDRLIGEEELRSRPRITLAKLLQQSLQRRVLGN